MTRFASIKSAAFAATAFALAAGAAATPASAGSFYYSGYSYHPTYHVQQQYYRPAYRSDYCPPSQQYYGHQDNYQNYGSYN